MTARVGGGGLPTGWPGVSRPVARGQKFMCCVRNPRNINIFVRVPGREDSGTRTGWSVTGWPRNCLCAKCLCAFSGPHLRVICQKLANGYFANGYFENLGKVPRRPPPRERKGGKRLDPSGKNRQPSIRLKMCVSLANWKSKYPFTKYPFASLPICAHYDDPEVRHVCVCFPS